MKVRIVLLPRVTFDHIAREYSSIITEKYKNYFKLDDNHIPHVTIVTLKFDDSSLPKINNLVGQLSKKVEEFTLKVTDVSSNDRNFIGVYFEDSEIKKLQETIVSQLERLIKKWSASAVSHLTLTRLKSKTDIQGSIRLISDYPREDHIFDFLAVCEDSEHGTCRRILAKFPLKKENKIA